MTNRRNCMNTRNIAIEHRLTHWAQVMRERAEKGISIRAYCESIGIHENTYYYWQSRLREAACSGVQEVETSPKEQSLVPNGWTTLCVSEKSTQSQNLTVEIGGCSITVGEETDTELLTKICRALKAL